MIADALVRYSGFPQDQVILCYQSADGTTADSRTFCGIVEPQHHRTERWLLLVAFAGVRNGAGGFSFCRPMRK
jgi:hypothetical protein